MLSRLSLLQSARLANVSISGGLIKTDGDFRVLSRIQVALDSRLQPNHESPIIAAYVARNCSNGIAVEWWEFAPSEIILLLRRERAAMYSSRAGDTGNSPQNQLPIGAVDNPRPPTSHGGLRV
jgi:hypothetical protein